MKRVFITGVFLLGIISLTSCRETPEEKTVVKEVEVQKEVPEVEEEEQKGILERAGEKVDKKVNKEINEEIDKIDDN
ncbi:hypothetical protein SAMN05660776_2848 [Salegentibacter holothuriorum]|uniref:Lipoprotein n=1 Tax=Salegentibacter holothuriorum TaxID=241145 RepID=A0A1T5DUN9_9FLAO|nr:hypothetical protein [Salegentibacter holothuriorum]SKB75508.1 hypothetical protein SAMN05660776_2848 [Salegentibacter holothuriorum]